MTAGPDRIHAVASRSGIEYYRESACPDCGATVFQLEEAPDSPRLDDLSIFGIHRCHAIPLAQSPDASAAPRARSAGRTALPKSPAGFPVEVGRLSAEAVEELRTAVEAAFGKPLRRFSGVLARKGLPIHYSPDWRPFLGHVREFSRSDVHRELPATAALFALALPHVRTHFAKEAGTGLRKYFFNARGVTKHERTRSLPVIVWALPARR